MRRVAGLDLAAGRGVTAVAILELDGDGSVRIAGDKSRRLSTDQEILEALAVFRPRVLAIDAPLSLPRAVASALSPRAAETAPPESSPYTRAAERDAVWTSLGVRPFPVSFLGGLTFRAIALTARIRASLPETIVIETFPTATFRALGFTAAPRAGMQKARKSTQEAREALQFRLASVVHGVPQAKERLLDADSLDAIGAALAAAAFERGEYLAIGDALEGQLILPGPTFRLATITSA